MLSYLRDMVHSAGSLSLYSPKSSSDLMGLLPGEICGRIVIAQSGGEV